MFMRSKQISNLVLSCAILSGLLSPAIKAVPVYNKNPKVGQSNFNAKVGYSSVFVPVREQNAIPADQNSFLNKWLSSLNPVTQGLRNNESLLLAHGSRNVTPLKAKNSINGWDQTEVTDAISKLSFKIGELLGEQLATQVLDNVLDPIFNYTVAPVLDKFIEKLASKANNSRFGFLILPPPSPATDETVKHSERFISKPVYSLPTPNAIQWAVERRGVMCSNFRFSIGKLHITLGWPIYYRLPDKVLELVFDIFTDSSTKERLLMRPTHEQQDPSAPFFLHSFDKTPVAVVSSYDEVFGSPAYSKAEEKFFSSESVVLFIQLRLDDIDEWEWLNDSEIYDILSGKSMMAVLYDFSTPSDTFQKIHDSHKSITARYN